MGAIGADINAVEIVQKNDGYVVDDFMLELPQGTLPDAIVSACTAKNDSFSDLSSSTTFSSGSATE
mgnify:CR=1 FL=1